ncbi:uncharacterized protein Z519_08771 [Cladophialophora bantiana CBS 173.52]|uniref:GPR1/FUN34/YaaH-class plasma membrane protein n=1 Tax=Cladophialophora bantiana (strain ATCC 10958 / CBS 173.52 / CDC B-1940 / NIH 8579) TaxID=1442370 RepID=A0A0D2HCL6_CLAB1|nr:uncharacterized protein Z519_08771 [Cladophialophora bantiana CBS 173.52]KIW90988.1 hypothetical protein Z519_08771 [Cladophialophora bantiana CBS 173.52]
MATNGLENDNLTNGGTSLEPIHPAGSHDQHSDYLTRYETTSKMMPRDEFASMYLTPYTARLGHLRSTFANPTPMPLMGFLIAALPLGCNLMEWRGSGGQGAALIGTFFFFGGLLQLLGAVLEWIIGNTFPFIVFACYGAFWLALGATLQPEFNAQTFYLTQPDGIAEFYSSYAFFFLAMALVTFFFLVASLRTNITFALVFFFIDLAFIMLMACYWTVADGNVNTARKCQKAAGAFVFVFSILGWYLFFTLILQSVDFPIKLPLGDLSTKIPGASEKKKEPTPKA